MKKAILLMVLMLFSIQFVSASFPDFSTTDLLEDDVINGNNDFGDILFLAKPYIPQNYIKGTMTGFQVQRYDVMKWNSADSVRVKNPANQEMILVNGSDYYFSLAGQYTMTEMLNTSNFVLINATPEENITAQISVVTIPKGFNLTFSKTNFTITTEEVVSANLLVDDDVKTGSYSLKYSINGVEKSKSFTVKENTNWTVQTSNFTFNSSIKAGEGQYLGRLSITNNGNTDIELVVTKSGNGSSLIGIPQPQTIYRKNTVYVDIQAQVPTVQKSGIYDINLSLSAENITNSYKVQITTTDNILPTIEQINFSSDRVYVSNDIVVLATDNNDVKNVTMTYDGITKILVKDKNLFTTQIKFDKLSRYVFEFCATDGDGNRECETVDKIFSKVILINNATPSYIMPSVRYGKYSKVKLFEITERINEGVTMTMMDVHTSGVSVNLSNASQLSQPIYRIIDSKGSIKQFPDVGSITIFEKGPVYLEVRADETMNVDGTIRLDMPEQFQEVSDLTFKVSFKNYDVPQDFEVAWVEGRKVTCKVKDTGDLDSSYFDCNVRYPVSTQPGDISIPTTVGERDKFKNEAELVQEELDNVKLKSGFFVAILSFMFVAVLLTCLYFIYWHPFVRFKVGAKKSVKTKDGREL